MWPNCESVAKKCASLYNEYKEGKDISKYKTTGTEDKRVIEKKSFRRTNDYKSYKDQSMS